MACRFGLGSVTYAMVAQSTLSRYSIRAKVIKLDHGESPRGCAYGIELERQDRHKASHILTRHGISFRELR